MPKKDTYEGAREVAETLSVITSNGALIAGVSVFLGERQIAKNIAEVTLGIGASATMAGAMALAAKRDKKKENGNQ